MFDIYQTERGITPRRGTNGLTRRQELLAPVFRRRAFQCPRGLAPRRPAVWRDWRQPALLDNPILMLISPMYLFAKLFVALGFRRDLAALLQKSSA